MRALLYLLTLTLFCFLKNGFCGKFEDFLEDEEAMALVEKYNNNQISSKIDLRNQLKNIGFELCRDTLDKYLGILTAAGGGSHKSTFEHFKNDRAAMALVEQFNNKQIDITQLLEALRKRGHKMGRTMLYEYLKQLKKEKEAGGGVPNLQATQIAGQSYNFTSGNPGSSTSASKKGKSTNFSKAPGASSHYGGALPSQQAPPMHDTHSWWSGENLQNDDGDLASVVNPPSSWKNALGALSNWFAQQSSNFTSGNPGSSTSELNKGKSTNFSKAPGASSHYGGAMPSQQAPPMHDTHSWWSGENLQNNDGDLASVVRPKNTSSWKGFDTAPYFPNQSQSTGRTSASNFFSPTPNTSNFNSGIRGSSSHYGGTIPYQQVPPMSGTSFPAFPNPFNQSAPLNPSTNFGPSQAGTNSLDCSEGNSQENDGTLASVVRPKRPSSSKGKSTTKPGKKPRK